MNDPMVFRHAQTREVVHVWFESGEPVRAELAGLPTSDSFIRVADATESEFYSESVLAATRAELVAGRLVDETPDDPDTEQPPAPACRSCSNACPPGQEVCARCLRQAMAEYSNLRRSA